jgi:hypothetical protein
MGNSLFEAAILNDSEYSMGEKYKPEQAADNQEHRYENNYLLQCIHLLLQVNKL